MTEGQQELYSFLLEFFEQNQRFPKIREMMKHFKLSSPSGIQARLELLRSSGYIDWQIRKPGTLRLTGYRVKLEKIEA
jgi:SOS-response transcriptional repressor LexA